MIKKYIKKTIPVEAVQWRGSDCTDNQLKWIFDKTYVEIKDEDDEFISVRKDRLEEVLNNAYVLSSFCPLFKTGACKFNTTGCPNCRYEFKYFEIKFLENAIKWLEGE